MSRVLLVYPPRTHLVGSGLPLVVEKGLGFYQPLGLLYLAAEIQRRGKHEVRILDCQAERVGAEDFSAILDDFAPDIVGVSVLTFLLYDALEVSRAVKAWDPAVHLCWGGPHVQIYGEESLAFGVVDSVVQGEGEETFADLVDRLAEGGTLEQVLGVLWESGGRVERNPPRPLRRDLDGVAPPDRRMLPLEGYRSLVDRDRFSTTMLSSRGCPHSCTFCDVPDKSYRQRSPSSIVAEMKVCLELGIREVYFFDDVFNLNKRRVLDLCAAIAQEQLPIRWAFRGRVHPFDEEMAAALTRAGCVRIQFGVESASDAVLGRIQKGISVEHVRTAFAAAHAAGIETLAYLMIGLPGETRSDVLRTIEFAKELGPQYAMFTIATPFPDTAMYAEALERSLIPKDYWGEYARAPVARLRNWYWEEHLGHDELKRLLRRAYREFYFRPSYLRGALLHSGSVHHLARKIRGGVSMLLGGLRYGASGNPAERSVDRSSGFRRQAASSPPGGVTLPRFPGPVC
jgi:anaerobic magnesium-protoporphyrin IX monomethyl ester cyclase